METPANISLATYGTLAPGRPNHHQLSGLKGHWRTGSVRGQLFDKGWGAAQGYPGIVLDPHGPEVEVQVFTSNDLPSHWSRLDDFEGDGYRRVEIRVATPSGEVLAYIYVLADSGAQSPAG